MNEPSPSCVGINCENDIECTKPALVRCHHCPKRLCLKHVLEHNEFNIVRTYELADQINSLTQLLFKLDCEKSLEEAKKKLDQWKENLLGNIEKTYEFYSKEIDYLQNELSHRVDIFKEHQRAKLIVLQNQILSLQKVGEISQQQLSPIERDLDQLRSCLESIRCEISIETKEISIKDLIDAQNIFTYVRPSSNYSILSPYRILSIENYKRFVSSKDHQTILWFDNRKHLHFTDSKYENHQLTLPNITTNLLPTASNNLPLNQNNLKDFDIVDMKWCSIHQVFFVLFQRHLFSFDPKTLTFHPIHLPRHKEYPFRCLSYLNDSSLYISYCVFGICIELWKYQTNSNGNSTTMTNILYTNPVKRWDRLANEKTEWVSHMDHNQIGQIGLLVRTASSIHTRFELRDEQMTLIKQINLNDDFVELFYPFRSNLWFIKSSSGHYYVYSTENQTTENSTFDFPFGLQEFGVNSIIVGQGPNEIKLCDV